MGYNNPMNITSKFLPVSYADMAERGWDELDFLYISGDAYVDHPSFGTAILTRLLEAEGYRVGIIALPQWHDVSDFTVLGRPKYAALIGTGVIDSMVNRYTVAKRWRSTDVYAPGGKAGMRPDRAVIVYANRVREAFKDLPVIIGGIEASLRRFAHYDYWSDSVRRSVLLDSKADLLIYGMGEKPLTEIARRLAAGESIAEIHDVRGTCYLTNSLKGIPIGPKQGIRLPSFEEVKNDKRTYAKAFKYQYEEQDPIRGRSLIQPHGDRFLVQNPPAMPLSIEEMDRIYALPYQRTYHPQYEAAGGVPALDEVEFSITSNRGCFGGCSFCSINFHQGQIIQKRSRESILAEGHLLTNQKNFKGYIHDLGGATANFRNPACDLQAKRGACKNRQCLAQGGCPSLKVDHREYLGLLRQLRQLPGVKRVFVRSGIRYDYLMMDKNDEFFIELCKHHISGQLRVAPEHISNRVLRLMGKPSRRVYENFARKFKAINQKLHKDQYLVPYLMSGHPGSDLEAAIELAEYLRDIHHQPEQVQDFYPTPGSLATCMFYTEIDPRTMEPVYVPKSTKDKQMQRALLQYRNSANYKLVYDALMQAGREDLIGYDRKCLIRPTPPTRGGGRPIREASKGGRSSREVPLSGVDQGKNKEGFKDKSPGGRGKRRKG